MSEHQFATDDDLDLSAPPRTRRLVAALVIGLHVVAVLGLIQAFAPGFTAKVTEQVISTFTVTVTVTTPPPSPKPPPPKAPDKAGAAAPEGKKAVPKAAAAPKPKVLIAQRPAPPGGREARFGKSVTVVFTVTPDGRARHCSVARSSVDAEATALVCPLVIRKIRFNPATRGDGTPIEARYGYRVDFRAR